MGENIDEINALENKAQRGKIRTIILKKREDYWNKDYAKYWMERVNEANDERLNSSQIVIEDSKTTSNNSYINAISLLKIKKTEDVIEIGCGFGRSLHFLSKLAKNVTALDISVSMIEIAKDNIKSNNVFFVVSPSEKTPFSRNSFNVAVCFASFDAMYQTEALIEINRICKKNARVLITGKNDNYYDDDLAAFNAEIGARNKKHPNYFTDVNKLIRMIEDFGFIIDVEQYYLRRGDFSLGNFKFNFPDKFYEYLFVLRKISDANIKKGEIISGTMSKTYIRKSSKLDH